MEQEGKEYLNILMGIGQSADHHDIQAIATATLPIFSSDRAAARGTANSGSWSMSIFHETTCIRNSAWDDSVACCLVFTRLLLFFLSPFHKSLPSFFPISLTRHRRFSLICFCCFCYYFLFFFQHKVDLSLESTISKYDLLIFAHCYFFSFFLFHPVQGRPVLGY